MNRLSIKRRHAAVIQNPHLIRPRVSTLQRGFTLVEMIVVVAIVAIIAAVAVPAFDDYFETVRIRRAVEEIRGLIIQAKSEGPIRDRNMSIAINTGQWCVGFAAIPNCDCVAQAGAQACTIDVAGVPVLQVVQGIDFPGVTITTTFPANGSTINRLRGTASPAGTVKVASGEKVVDIRLSLYGRVRVCAPFGSNGKSGYSSC